MRSHPAPSRLVLQLAFVVLVILAAAPSKAVFAQDEGPMADAGGPYSGAPGQNVQLTGVASSDPDGWIISYEWDFGDGTTGSGEMPAHAYSLEGTYWVTLTVTDSNGATSTTGSTVIVNALTT